MCDLATLLITKFNEVQIFFGLELLTKTLNSMLKRDMDLNNTIDDIDYEYCVQ